MFKQIPCLARIKCAHWINVSKQTVKTPVGIQYSSEITAVTHHQPLNTCFQRLLTNTNKLK